MGDEKRRREGWNKARRDPHIFFVLQELLLVKTLIALALRFSPGSELRNRDRMIAYFEGCSRRRGILGTY